MSSSLNQCEAIERNLLIKYSITYLTSRDVAVVQADYAAYDVPTFIGRYRPDVIGRTAKRRYVVGLSRTDMDNLMAEESQTQIESFALAALEHPDIERFYLFIPTACRTEAMRLLRCKGVNGRHVEVVGVSFAPLRILPTAATG